MRSFWNELRITVRTLAKTRGFTIAATVTLALGIGLAATAMAVLNAYLVRSLPYPAAERLYRVTYAQPGQEQPRGLADLPWESLADVIEHPVAWDLDVFYLTGGERTEVAPGAWVTPGFMQGLGIRVGMGRTFGPADFERGAPQVALISDDLWRTKFGRDPAVIGRSLQAYVSDRPRDPETFSIVGVLPADFWHFNQYTQVLTPLRAPTYPYFVRIRETAPVSAVERRITGLVRDSRATLPDGWGVTLQPVHEGYVASVKPILLAVGTAVGLVLLMACANVALLVLLRGMRRQKEIALRLALGAARTRIARMLLLETLVITAASAVAGTFAAWLVLRSLAPTIEQQLGARAPGGQSAVAIDLNVIAAIVVVTLAVAFLLSLAPILTTVRRNLFTTLRQTRSDSAGGSGGRRTRYALIGLEVAGSLTLLVGSGLMVKTVMRMLDVELGARYAGLVVAALAVREQSYPTVGDRAELYDRLLTSLQGARGVSDIALTTPSPLVSYVAQPIRTDDATAPARSAAVRPITPGYFVALGIPLLQGRAFTADDRGSAQRVAIISESAARRLWPTANAIGRQIRFPERQITGGDSTLVARTVVGIVRDARQSPTDDDIADVYIPVAQAAGRFVIVVARPIGSAAAWTEELRRTVASVDREIAVRTPESLDAIVEAQVARPRFLASLFGAFGLFASLLGVIGLYTVIAYAVKQREHEIAVRMAVGAGGGAILNLFMREGILLLVIGIAAGSFAAVGLGRLLEAQLFGVRAVDPATIAAAAVGLGLASLAAIWWPARRATRTDPIGALREE